MAGGWLGGLTNQTLRPLSCGFDSPDYIGTARPHKSDRYGQGWLNNRLYILYKRFVKQLIT